MRKRLTGRLDITLEAVSVRRGRLWALRDVSLRLKGGERWALIGANGSGKTQLLKLLAADVWPTPTGHERRNYSIGRRPVELADAKHRIAYVGAERQDKYVRYGWDLAVADLVATGLHGTDLLLQPVSPGQRRRVDKVLSACGLSRYAGAKFLTLSSGRQRLALLARALVQETDWLLLDEFYNGLDGACRRRVDALLNGLRRRGVGWIATAHRTIDVPRGTTRVMELDGGRLRAAGALRRGTLSRLALLAAEVEPRKSVARSRAGRQGRAGAARRASAAARSGAGRGKPIVTLEGVDVYVDYRLVLRDVNWELRRGQHWAVQGANGAGKSTFLKLLYGDLSPALGGTIVRSGCPAGTPIESWKRHVGFVSPQLQADYAVNVTLFDLVASGRYSSIGLAQAASAADRRAANRWLAYFGLLPMAGRVPRELSYGQLRRALIARALAADARLLLLDEPLTGLDPEQRAAMKRLLERLMADGITLVVAVHHDEDLPRGMTHRLHLHKRRATATES
jgi:molybdate transport system ATP-binding protein